jgi:hypothetical protein
MSSRLTAQGNPWIHLVGFSHKAIPFFCTELATTEIRDVVCWLPPREAGAPRPIRNLKQELRIWLFSLKNRTQKLNRADGLWLDVLKVGADPFHANHADRRRRFASSACQLLPKYSFCLNLSARLFT